MLYDVFLSYSHAMDGNLAPALQAGLQQFARPWNRLRAMRAFRDKTGLSANPGLWSAIEQALDNTDNFVLLPSPGAARSPWVQKEVEHWLSRAAGRNRSMFLVLTDGEITWDGSVGDFDWSTTTALPRNLAGRFAEEPLWVDLRWAKTEEHLSLQNPAFRDVVADLSSAIRQVPKDQLIGEDVQQHRKAVLFRRSSITGLVVLAVALAGAALLAMSQRNLARNNEAQARHNEQIAEQNRQLAAANEKTAKDNEALAKSNETLARESEANAKKQEAAALRRLYISQVNLAYHAWSEDNPAVALKLLEEQLPMPGQADLRSFEWYYLWHLAHGYLANIVENEAVTAAVTAADGQTVAIATEAGKVSLYDSKGVLKRRLAGTSTADPFDHLAFAVHGKLIGLTCPWRILNLAPFPVHSEFW